MCKCCPPTPAVDPDAPAIQRTKHNSIASQICEQHAAEARELRIVGRLVRSKGLAQPQWPLTHGRRVDYIASTRIEPSRNQSQTNRSWFNLIQSVAHPSRQQCCPCLTPRAPWTATSSSGKPTAGLRSSSTRAHQGHPTPVYRRRNKLARAVCALLLFHQLCCRPRRRLFHQKMGGSVCADCSCYMAAATLDPSRSATMLGGRRLISPANVLAALIVATPPPHGNPVNA